MAVTFSETLLKHVSLSDDLFDRPISISLDLVHANKELRWNNTQPFEFMWGYFNLHVGSVDFFEEEVIYEAEIQLLASNEWKQDFSSLKEDLSTARGFLGVSGLEGETGKLCGMIQFSKDELETIWNCALNSTIQLDISLKVHQVNAWLVQGSSILINRLGAPSVISDAHLIVSRKSILKEMAHA